MFEYLDLIRFKYIICFLVIISWAGCDSDPGLESPDLTDPSKTEVETIIPDGSENYLNIDSDYIFDQNSLHTFELTIPDANLAKINADPAAEVYVEGSLTFQGETLSPVGIRYKGSIGAYVGCVSGSDWTNPSGHKTCTKLSMKVKINWNDKDDKFYGLKKLQLHSQNLDDSQMRERLGYWLFAAMGVPAPRCVHARLVINGKFNGIFSLVEQIDGRFTRENFDDGTGNLYKEVWPIDMHGKAQHERTYLEALRTNEDENPSVEMIRTFGQEIASSNPENIKGIVAKWMNIDEIISYVVVDRMIRVDDGPFHWYCGGNGCSNHNYYWYEEPTANTMHLIPWDLDNAFENIVSDQNPVTPIADDWGAVSADCEPFSFGAFGIKQRSAACDKLISGWVKFIEEYQLKKSEFVSGPFEEAKVNDMLDTWSEQISDATLEASQLYNDALTMDRWEHGVNTLKFSLNVARNK